MRVHDDDDDDHDEDDHGSPQCRRAFLEAVVGSPQPATTTTADLIVDLLVPRLSAHILSRVRDVRKQDHCCMKWVASNLPNMVALLVTRDLIKLDLSTATTKSCLLRQERDVFDAITATNMHFEGAYLCYNAELLTWIRSGKVAGENRQLPYAAQARQGVCNGNFQLPTSTDGTQASRFRRHSGTAVGVGSPAPWALYRPWLRPVGCGSGGAHLRHGRQLPLPLASLGPGPHPPRRRDAAAVPTQVRELPVGAGV